MVVDRGGAYFLAGIGQVIIGVIMAVFTPVSFIGILCLCPTDRADIGVNRCHVNFPLLVLLQYMKPHNDCFVKNEYITWGAIHRIVQLV